MVRTVFFISDPAFISNSSHDNPFTDHVEEMAGFLEDRMRLFRFLSVIHFVGNSFLKLCSFTSVVKKYVCGEKEQIVLDGKRKRMDGEDETFAREVEGFFYLFPEFGDVERGFSDFHNFSLNCGKPIATVLVSTQERCRMCGKALAVDPNIHVNIFKPPRTVQWPDILQVSRNPTSGTTTRH